QPVHPRRLTAIPNALVFVADGADGVTQMLWRTDGSVNGMYVLLQRPNFSFLTALPDRLLFAVSDPSHPEVPQEVWQSDGTEAGTVGLLTLPQYHPVSGITAVGAAAYFFFNDSFTSSLWRLSGTDLTEIAEIDGTVDDDPQLTPVGSKLYFRLDDGRIWSTDGTPAGTAPLPNVISAHRLAELGGSLYFLTLDEGALWRSDGSAAGTVLLKETGASFFRFPTPLVKAGGRLFFATRDDRRGPELWTTDGTATGTAVVRDFGPDRATPVSTSLTAVGDQVFFTASDGTHGLEMWRSDGTAAGTRMIQDIAPEAASSAPASYTTVGDRLYFSAWQDTSGRELWTMPLTPSSCQPSPTVLCLAAGRFRVEAVWRDRDQHAGVGQAVPLTADTGYFWFFDSGNVEVMVKVLDGRGLNDHFWVFYGALSDVEYSLTVTDTQTGLSREYHNPAGQLASVGDTHGFGPLGAYSTSAPASPSVLAASAPSETHLSAAALAPCEAGPTRLCLGGGRFAADASWQDFSGHSGQGSAVPLSADTGYFWFFDSANVEVVLKVLDGTPVNGKHWVFYGALSNVAYTLTLTDTATGIVRTYTNPSGRFASVADTSAF
ncbi:MAG TPA: ELWxxDGT repeat protein, partial [Thermoanaerobaculia bacterium]